MMNARYVGAHCPYVSHASFPCQQSSRKLLFSCPKLLGWHAVGAIVVICAYDFCHSVRELNNLAKCSFCQYTIRKNRQYVA